MPTPFDTSSFSCYIRRVTVTMSLVKGECAGPFASLYVCTFVCVCLGCGWHIVPAYLCMSMYVRLGERLAVLMYLHKCTACGHFTVTVRMCDCKTMQCMNSAHVGLSLQ